MGHRRFTVDVAPAELATPDELRALQLERLRATLVRVYRARAALPGEVRRRGRSSRRAPVARGSRALPVHHQGRPAGELPVRHVRRAAAQGRAHSRLERDDRPADRRRVHAARHRHLGRRDGAVAPRGRRVRDGHHPRRVRLRALHRGPGRALRRRAPRRDGGAGVGRPDRAPGPADPRLLADGADVDAFVRARDRRRVRAPGARSARHHAAARALRRRALDRGHAPRDRGAVRDRRRRPVRAIGGDGARRREPNASRRRTRRTSGRTTSIRRSWIRRPAGCSRTASRASSSSPRSPRKRCPSSATARAT